MTTETEAKIDLCEVTRYQTAADAPENDERPTGAPPADLSACQDYRVALVCMPFERATAPSIQVGLLKAICRRAGFPTDDYYFSVEFARRIGFEVYWDIMGGVYVGWVGEWLASVAAFGERASREDFFAAYPAFAQRIYDNVGTDAAYLNDVRDRVMPQFVDDCLEGTDWGSYDAVVFVSHFQQTVASLALARRIKERYPNVQIVLCGKNMDGPIGAEHARAFPYLDYVICGEHEEVVPELLDRLAEGRDPVNLLGVAARRGGDVTFSGLAKPIADLDSLPTPDYDTFFRIFPRLQSDTYAAGLNGKFVMATEVGIPIESGRGCWWAEKSRCAFCGILGTTSAARKKSSARLLAEADELSSRYGIRQFGSQDPLLDMGHINDFFEPLGDRADGYTFFFCLKANLRRDQLRTLARGGLKSYVVGIESFNTRLLKQMGRGATRLQNVNVLRWGTYYGLQVIWNLLYGFPGETIKDYSTQLETLGLIRHVHAAHHIQRIRLERFSPYFSGNTIFPTKWRRPARVYDFIYPPEVDKEAAAWYFDYELEGELSDDDRYQHYAFIERWKREWYTPNMKSKLIYRRDNGDILIEDTRFDLNQPSAYTLLGLDAAVYEAASDAPRSPARICAALQSECSSFHPNEEEVGVACEAMCEAGLMLGEAGKYLSLALPADPEEWLVTPRTSANPPTGFPASPCCS